MPVLFLLNSKEVRERRKENSREKKWSSHWPFGNCTYRPTFAFQERMTATIPMKSITIHVHILSGVVSSRLPPLSEKGIQPLRSNGLGKWVLPDPACAKPQVRTPLFPRREQMRKEADMRFAIDGRIGGRQSLWFIYTPASSQSVS